jgi:anti-anti-sigma factor
MDNLFSIEKLDRVTAVTFLAPSLMNAMELDRIGKSLESLVDDGARSIVLDFAKVEFLSSLGIRMILSLQQKLKKAKGNGLIICGISAQLAELLRITKLDRVLKVAGSRADAITMAK